eukprot:350751-Karenia_brevis.AAC.1
MVMMMMVMMVMMMMEMMQDVQMLRILRNIRSKMPEYRVDHASLAPPESPKMSGYIFWECWTQPWHAPVDDADDDDDDDGDDDDDDNGGEGDDAVDEGDVRILRQIRSKMPEYCVYHASSAPKTGNLRNPQK